MKKQPLNLSTIATDFLATLLWLADNPDNRRRPFAGKSVADFTPAFATAAAGFADGFVPWLESRGFDTARLAALSRSVGGSLYLSLSGHGAGFFDESPPGDYDLGRELHRLAAEYAGGRYLFEGLEGMLCCHRGKVDLAILPEYKGKYLTRYFATHATA